MCVKLPLTVYFWSIVDLLSPSSIVVLYLFYLLPFFKTRNGRRLYKPSCTFKVLNSSIVGGNSVKAGELQKVTYGYL